MTTFASAPETRVAYPNYTGEDGRPLIIHPDEAREVLSDLAVLDRYAGIADVDAARTRLRWQLSSSCKLAQALVAYYETHGDGPADENLIRATEQLVLLLDIHDRADSRS